MATALPARAELVVSDLVVDLAAGSEPRKDVEVWNNSDERSYVEIAPLEVLNAGTPQEQRVREPDPEKLGLLVSPARMILEPQQRKVVRFARIVPAVAKERVYRVTVKPVVGEVTGEQSGLKVLVGYDVLVLVRPSNPQPVVRASREGNTLVLRNEGNSSVELMNGRQCQVTASCVELPGKRLYAGASWSQQLPGTGPVEYLVKEGKQSKPARF